MLGFITAQGRGAADRLIREVALTLEGRGHRLAGAVQHNVEADGARCHMDLHLLGQERAIRISQDLGTEAQGCRLDPDGLERAVGLIGAALTSGPALLVVNKFGKQELDGRGFRPLIAEALGQDIPVLTAVSETAAPRFLDWAGDYATALPSDKAAVLDWAHRMGLG